MQSKSPRAAEASWSFLPDVPRGLLRGAPPLGKDAFGAMATLYETTDPT